MDSFRTIASLFAVIAALLLTPVASADAADTGSISGTVFDTSGEPVAEAIVRLSGDALPAGRSARSSVNGSFRFDYLVPGDYVVEVEVSTTSTSRRIVRVELGKDTQ